MNEATPPVQGPDADAPLLDPAAVLAAGGDAVLEPGDHLVELEVDGELDAASLEQGLARMGFRQAVLDESAKSDPANAMSGAWGSELVRPSVSTFGETLRLVRFLARNEGRMRLMNLPYLRWLHVGRVGFDAFANVGAERQAEEVHGGRSYELRFLSRLKGQPRRDDVAAALKEAGFTLLKAIALKTNMRLPGRSALTTLWYATARYNGPDGFLTTVEPLWFEDVREVTA